MYLGAEECNGASCDIRATVSIESSYASSALFNVRSRVDLSATMISLHQCFLHYLLILRHLSIQPICCQKVLDGISHVQ